MKHKIGDYRIEAYERKLDTLRSNLANILASKPFMDEMTRFLPADVFDRTLSQPRFMQYLQDTLDELLQTIQENLGPGAPGQPPFRM